MSKKKKTKTIAAKAPSTNALALADDLLEIARNDLRAARLLQDGGLPPQAVFFLQQAVEKIGKAYGLAMGVADPSELQKDWSHNPLKLSEVFADYREQQAVVSPASKG